MIKKFNFIDILIAVVLIIVVACSILYNKKPDSTPEQQKHKLVTLEIPEKHLGFKDNVVIGDKVTEKVEKKEIGVIKDVYTEPCTKNTYDNINKKAKIATIPEHENVYVVIETNINNPVRVGKLLSIITKHFSGHGYVTNITEAKE